MLGIVPPRIVVAVRFVPGRSAEGSVAEAFRLGRSDAGEGIKGTWI